MTNFDTNTLEGKLAAIKAGDVATIRKWIEDKDVCLTDVTRGAFRSIFAHADRLAEAAEAQKLRADATLALVDKDLLAENHRLREELVETQNHLSAMRHSFDLRWDADQRAIKRWREAVPGRDLVMPDHADLCVWLLSLLMDVVPPPPHVVGPDRVSEMRARIPHDVLAALYLRIESAIAAARDDGSSDVRWEELQEAADAALERFDDVYNDWIDRVGNGAAT